MTKSCKFSLDLCGACLNVIFWVFFFPLIIFLNMFCRSFDKHKTSEGNGDKHFSKIVEQFEERKRKLEDDLWE